MRHTSHRAVSITKAASVLFIASLALAGMGCETTLSFKGLYPTQEFKDGSKSYDLNASRKEKHEIDSKRPDGLFQPAQNAGAAQKDDKGFDQLD